MKKARKGFTLIETLVVVAVIVVLAAITYPAFRAAKVSANKADSISNMRQCVAALLIYSVDWNDKLPKDSARDVLASAPTCDRADYWRESCEEQSEDPLIGSYAYVLLTERFYEDEAWAEFQSEVSYTPLLASIWYSSHRIAKFEGDAPRDPLDCGRKKECIFPDEILFAGYDGSLKKHKRVSLRQTARGFGARLLRWSDIFDPEFFQ